MLKRTTTIEISKDVALGFANMIDDELGNIHKLDIFLERKGIDPQRSNRQLHKYAQELYNIRVHLKSFLAV